MINELLLQFGQWLEAQQYSQMLVAGYFSYSWLEATHVLSLMICIGSLFIIDFRMLGLIMPNVPATTYSGLIAQTHANRLWHHVFHGSPAGLRQTSRNYSESVVQDQDDPVGPGVY